MKHAARAVVYVGLVALGAVSAGCETSPYLRGFRYAPEPALVDVMRKGGESQRPPLSVLVSVIGVRRGGTAAAAPPAVEIRMRFENNGMVPVTFDPSTLSLVTATLQNFQPPEVHGPRPLQINPGQDAQISVFFPFPPGVDPRYSGTQSLRLRWQVQIDGQVVPQTALFERTAPLYYEG